MVGATHAPRHEGPTLKVTIRTRASHHAVECGPHERILYAALRAGIGVSYECATGTCGTCKARARPGTVEDVWPEAPGLAGLKRERGEFLMCQGVALGDCEILVPSRIEADAGGARQPRRLSGTLAGIRPLTRDVTAFQVVLDRLVAFDAGQFAVLAVPGLAGYRAYSMTNFAARTDRLDFVIKHKPGGGFSDWLASGRSNRVRDGEGVHGRSSGSDPAEPGSGCADSAPGGRDARVPGSAGQVRSSGSGSVEPAPGRAGAALDLFGPLGKATWRPEEDRDLVCIAGGSGIAGMMSILSHAASSGHFERRRGDVFFGVRSREDVFFTGELAHLVESAAGRLSVTVAFSEEPAAARDPRIPRCIDVARGFVHSVAGERMAGAWNDPTAFVAGPPPMVDAALRMLITEARLPASRIRYDKFT